MGAYNTKQYILIRKDLKMNKGKLAAQAAHASMGALLTLCKNTPEGRLIPMEGATKEWLDGSFAKVALAVDSEEELMDYYMKAVEMGLPASYIVDNGTTVFHGEKTPTCVGIGPAYSEELEPLCKNLKLF